MLSFLKPSKKKTPGKGKSFYDRENAIQTINELNNFLDYLNSSKTTKISSNILFQGFELDSIVEKNLKKDFGEAAYCLEPDNGIHNHKIYYYRTSSQHLRFIIQIHFIESQFFFANIKAYSDSFLSIPDKQKVIEQIINKYFPDADNQTFEFALVDGKGNVLITHDHMYYNIRYLANNSLSQKLKKQYAEHESPRPRQEIIDTLDKLI